MVRSEHHPGTAKAGDHFVGDEQSAVFMRDFEQARQEFRRRDDVAGRALNGFHNDRGEAARRIVLDDFADEIQAEHAASRIVHVKGAAVAVRIRSQMQAGMKDPPMLFEWITNEPEHASSLAVESSPEAQDFKFPGIRFRQPDGSFDGLGPPL